MPTRARGLPDLLEVAAALRGEAVASLHLRGHDGRVEHVPFAEHVLDGGQPLHLGDAASDVRFDALTAVRSGSVRGVSAVPLRRDGELVGALVVSSAEPGSLSAAQRQALDAVARQVVAHLDLTEVADRADALLGRASLLVCTIGADGRIGFMSEALQALLPPGNEAHVGGPARLLVAADGRHLFDEWLGPALATPGAQPPHFAPIGDDRYVELMAANHVEDPAIEAIVVAVRDITARRAEIIAAQTLQAVTEAAHHADRFDSAASTVLAELCERAELACGSVYLADRARRCYVASPARYADDPAALAPFLDSTIARPIGFDTGVPGEVFRYGEPRWIEDMTDDPSLLRGVLADRVGLRLLVAVPVIAEGEVVGVLEVAGRKARSHDPALLRLLSTAADQLARVAERQAAREAVAAGEERLRRVLDTANDAFVSIDEWGLITAWNLRAERTFGWTAEEAIGQPLEQLIIPEEQRAAHRVGVARLASGGESRLAGRTLEVEAVDRHGHRLPIELTLWTVEDGGRRRFNAFARDITERVEREAVLRANDARLRAAQEIAQIGSWEWDVEADVGQWSETLYEMFGAVPDQFEPTLEAFVESLHPDDRARVEDIVLRAVHSGEPFEVHHRVVLPDGAVRHLHGRGEVVMENGRAVKLRGVARDVTESVLAEEQLRTSEARFRALTALAPTGIFLADAAGWPTYANEKWLEITGLQPSDSLGEAFLANVHRSDLEAVKEHWLACAEKGVEYDQRFRIVRADGAVRWIHGAAVALEVAGVRTGFVGTTTDITELVEASELKSAFLANMSHEIRTPMNAVLGLATLLVDAELPVEQREQVVGLQTAASNLLRIIDDILDFSKVEAGHLEIHPEPVDLHGLVRGVLSMFAPWAERTGVSLDVEWVDGVAPYVVADAVRLRQILTNLVGNAMKFTEQGSVAVRVEPASGGGLRVEVRDTGIGVDLAAQEHLFEPFSQADSSTTRRFGGTGLGLAICHQLVGLMGGEIGIDSAVGEGSRFWFTLPLEPCAPPDNAGHDELALAPTAPGRLLLAEDNELNQLVARAMLERLGFEVVVVGDGGAAVEAVKAGGFDAVLMDCQMPVLDGYDATREIRQFERGRRHTPVIAMTAAAMAGDRERCLAAGMDDYVAKPVAVDALLAALRRCARAMPELAAAAPPVAVGPAAGQPVLNPELASAFPAEVYDRVVATFLRATRERIDAMRAAVDAGDADELRRVAHSAKGASSTFGASELARVASELEQLGASGDLGSAGDLVASFASGFEDVEAAIGSTAATPGKG